MKKFKVGDKIKVTNTIRTDFILVAKKNQVATITFLNDSFIVLKLSNGIEHTLRIFEVENKITLYKKPNKNQTTEEKIIEDIKEGIKEKGFDVEKIKIHLEICENINLQSFNTWYVLQIRVLQGNINNSFCLRNIKYSLEKNEVGKEGEEIFKFLKESFNDVYKFGFNVA